MSKASLAIPTTPSSDNPARTAATIISQLINAKPQSPTVAEIEAVIASMVPPVAAFPGNGKLAEFLKLEAENHAEWQRFAGTGQDDPPSAKALDDKLHNWMDEFFSRPVIGWEDAAILGAIDLYWWRVAGGGDDGGLYPHASDMAPGVGYDVRAHAYLLTAIAKLCGRVQIGEVR